MLERVQQKLSKKGGENFLTGLNATLGLVIHAMADGIALGASSLTSNSSIGVIVFLAVIVHKGEFFTSTRRITQSFRIGC